jgi:hypothetical protein
MGQSDYIEVIVGLQGIIGAFTPAAEALPSPRRNPIRTKRVDVMLLWMRAVTLPGNLPLSA